MLYEGGSHYVVAIFAAVLRDLPDEFVATVFETTIFC